MAVIRTMLYTTEAWTRITATPEEFLSWCKQQHLDPATVTPKASKKRPGWLTVDAKILP